MNENRNTNQQQHSLGCPYVGLMPFTEKDAEYFFGRDRDIANVATNLRASSLTVFYGGSGVGKSSLLNAGVIPYLQKIAAQSVLPGKPTDFVPIVLREWVNNPVDELKLRIKSAVEKSVKADMIPHLAMTEVENTARDNKENKDLSQVLKIWTELIKTDLLIILDQFEDFFLHPEFVTGKGSFGEEFPRAVSNRNLPVNYIISLRADAIDKLDFFRGKIPNLMKNTLRLQPLDREETEDAIREPLLKYNKKMLTSFSIEDDLCEKLLDDLQVDKIKLDTQGQGNLNPFQSTTAEVKTTSAAPAADAPAATTITPPPAAAIGSTDSNGTFYQVETPYLQLVMVRLWEHKNTQRAQLLTLETLEQEMGGVPQIVESHLDKVMEQFNEKEKALAAEFIHFTVTRSGTKIPLSASDLAELAELEEGRRDEVTQILRRLSKGDNSIFKGVPNRRNPENPFYEVAHDALGPAILSWRKRENDARHQRLALEEEEEKRRQELAEMEAKRQAEINEQKRIQAEQAAQIEKEKEKRIHQEQILDAERRNRKLGRRVAILSNVAVVFIALTVAIVGYIYYDRYQKKKIVTAELEVAKNELVKENTYLQANVEEKTVNETFYKNSQTLTELGGAGAANYETELEQYKSLINILSNLQTGTVKSREIAMNRLLTKAKNGTLPAQYKPLFIDALKKIENSPNDRLRNETLAAVEQSQMKTGQGITARQTIIFLQYQKTEQEDNALKVKKLLEEKGYLTPSIEHVGEISFIKQTQLRYFRDDDEPRASEICKFLAEHNINAVPTRIGGYENSLSVRPNQFELWFTGAPIPNIQ